MKTTLAKCGIAGALAGAALLGFWSGQSRSPLVPAPAVDLPRVSAGAPPVTSKPTPGITRTAEVQAAMIADGPGVAADRAVADAGLPGGASTSPLVSELDEVPEEVQRLAQAHERFQEWLEKHPTEGYAETVRWLKALPAGEWNLSNLVFESITQSGNERAREAVTSVLTEPADYPSSVVLQAAQAVGDLGASSSASLRSTLRHLAESADSPESALLADAALYSLARLSQRDEITQQFLVEQLKPALGLGRSSEEAARALTLLGMAGIPDAQALSRAAQLATSNEAELRLAAREYIDRVQPDVEGDQ